MKKNIYEISVINLASIYINDIIIKVYISKYKNSMLILVITANDILKFTYFLSISFIITILKFYILNNSLKKKKESNLRLCWQLQKINYGKQKIYTVNC